MSFDLVERAATAALDCFNRLPDKCKPRIHEDGRREWTPMCAMMLTKKDKVTCVSLATGTKCLAGSIIPRCYGTVVHDSHAEILALRGFNRWVLNEIGHYQVHPDQNSGYVEPSYLNTETPHSQQIRQKPFKLKEDVSIHMFTTVAPCGDASMELLIASKDPADTIPWSAHGVQPEEVGMLGRGSFSELGRVRRKPSRGDAEATLSKSCSDKLAMKQYTSLLSFPTDLLVEPTDNTFLKLLIVYPDQFCETGYERAFGKQGRLSSNERDAIYFDIAVLPPTFPRFPFEKSCGNITPTKTSNTSALFIRGCGNGGVATHEVLINGVKQGFKQFDPREAKESIVCRKQMWSKGEQIMGHLSIFRASQSDIVTDLLAWDSVFLSYRDIKTSILRAERRRRKDQAVNRLGSWKRNSGDEDWHRVPGVESRHRDRAEPSVRR